MAHFAKLDSNNVVLAVIVVNNLDCLDENGNESESVGIEWLKKWCRNTHLNWRQTSYNANFRKNFAGVGYTFDLIRNAFIPPKPFNTWILNEETCQWEAPVPKPDPINGMVWVWNDSTANWQSLPIMR